MGTILEGFVRAIRKVCAVIVEGWKKLTGTDKVVTVIALGVVAFSVIFTGGILYTGAVFAISMVISIGLLAVMVPPLLRWLARYRVMIDFIVAVGALLLGFLSGSATLVVSLGMFGLCMTAGLRIAQAGQDYLPTDWNWNYIVPVWLTDVWSKSKPEEPTPAPETKTDAA